MLVINSYYFFYGVVGECRKFNLIICRLGIKRAEQENNVVGKFTSLIESGQIDEGVLLVYNVYIKRRWMSSRNLAVRF